MGYGSAIIFDDRHIFLPPIYPSLTSVLLVGSDYYISPGKKERIRFNLGAHYQRKNDWSTGTSLNYHHLYIPLGLALDFGKRVHFFFGGGINGKVLLKNHFSPGTDFNQFQVSPYFMLGFGYRASDKWDIKLEYRTIFDANYYYEISYTKSPAPGTYYDYRYESEGLLQLSVSYTLPKK